MSGFKTLIILIIAFVHLECFSQQERISIQKLLDSTRKVKDDSLRLALNRQFYDLLLATLENPGSPDTLNGLMIGQPVSSDGRLVFYNWNIQQNNGQNLYYAIAYLPNLNKAVPLAEKNPSQKLNPDSVYTPNDWPGALYYKIISPKKKGQNVYLLLGWDRFNRQTNRKTIEALTIINDSTLVFGKEIFKTKEGRASRVIIEYAASANLTLNYSKQSLRLTGVRKSQSRVNDSIIVIDRLMPLNESLEGQRWAYVPVGNIYDGYIYFKEYWTFVEGINARNPAIKREERRKHKKPDIDLLPKE